MDLKGTIQPPKVFLVNYFRFFVFLLSQCNCLKQFQVHSFYRLRPETAYLSINYLDRFLSARALPVCRFLLFGLFKKSLKIV